MWRLVCQRGTQVSGGCFCSLTRQPVHQVQVEIVKAGGFCHFDGPVSLITAVDAAQFFQLVILEALDTQR